MNYNSVFELDDYQEDFITINEPCFDVDPYIYWEIDLEYAQGEM